MKKSLITLLIIAMLACIGLVSCKNEVQVPAEELVSVSFENESSRALTASIEEFKPETYYWKYAAQKADTSNLISGATSTYDAAGAKWIKEGDQGPEAGFGTGNPYVAYKVEGFSQGLWNFTLYGYKWVDDGDEVKEADEFVLVYSGEITGHLLKAGDNNTHSVSAVVSPAGETAGTLKVLVSKIKLDAAAGVEVVANAKMKLGVSTGANPTYDIRALTFIEDDVWSMALAGGQYRVDVQFTNDDGAVVYASGSVIATVYSGLTTTVSGSLSEKVTWADFSATSDVVNTTMGIDDITTARTADISFGTTGDKVTATMPVVAAKSLISSLEDELGAKPSDPGNEYYSSLDLNLSVDTTEATETTVKYEIGMEATLTYEKIGADSGDKTKTTTAVKNLEKYVTVVVDVSSDVAGVYVKHSGVPMNVTTDIETAGESGGTPDTTADVDGETIYVGFYQYVPSDKKLYIKTKSFSPFEVTYSLNEYVAAIGTAKYKTLAEALTAANSGDEIVLLKNIKTADVINSSLSELTINLNGKTLEFEPASNNSNFGPTATFITVAAGKTLSITDNSTVPGTIKVDPKYRCTVYFVTVRGTLNLEKSKVVLDVSTYNQSVDQSVYGDKASSTNRASVSGISNYGTVNVDGTTISLNPSGKGGSITGITTQNNAKASILNADFFITAGATGVYAYNGSSNTIKKSSFSVTEEGTGISINGADATIEDCTIEMSGVKSTSASSAYGIAVNESATASTESAILISGNTAITADYEGYGATCLSVKAGAVIVDGSISIDAGENGTAVEFGASALSGFENSAHLEIRSGEYSGDVSSFSTNGTMVISGGSFSGDVYCSNGGNETDGNLRITGGSFTGGFGAAWYDTNNRRYMKISGGIFDEDPSDYVAEGYIADYNSQTEKWTVRPLGPEDYIAKIERSETTAYFMTVQDAFDAVEEGETVVLMKSFDDNNPVLFRKDVTASFDLDGKTLRIYGDVDGNDGGRAIKITAGTLTIKNGTIDGRDYDNDLVNPVPNPSTDQPWSANRIGGAVRVSGGNAILEDLVMYNNDGLGNAVKLDSEKSLTITDCEIRSTYGGGIEVGEGTATITGTTIILDQAVGTHYISTGIAVCSGGTANVSDCIVDSAGYALFCYSSSGSINISGGKYSGDVKLLSMETRAGGSEDNSVADNVVVFNSGTFDGEIYSDNQVYGSAELEYYNKLTINGGTFTNVSFSGATGLPNKISICGGTFDSDPWDYVASGYYAEYYPATSTWTVLPAPEHVVFALVNNETHAVTLIYEGSVYGTPSVSSITGNESSVPENHTLILLKDYVFVPAGSTFWSLINFAGDDITFDLKGHNFDYNNGLSAVFTVDNKAKRLTFKNGSIRNIETGSSDKELFYSSYVPDSNTFQHPGVTLVRVTYYPWN